MVHEKILSIILPALNEQEGIRCTIDGIPIEVLKSQGYKVEIIVVDGGSSDRTRQMALEMGAKVITDLRLGYGRAYKTGFEVAKGEVLVTMDADGSYPANKIPQYLQEMNNKGIDFITINRFSDLQPRAMSLSHAVGNMLLSALMRALYKLDIRDSQSGMWLMRREFIDKINLKSDNMSLSEEIKIIAFKFFRSVELEGEYRERVGTPKLNAVRHGWMNMRYLLHYRRWLKHAVRPVPTPSQGLEVPTMMTQKRKSMDFIEYSGAKHQSRESD